MSCDQVAPRVTFGPSYGPNIIPTSLSLPTQGSPAHSTMSDPHGGGTAETATGRPSHRPMNRVGWATLALFMVALGLALSLLNEGFR